MEKRIDRKVAMGIIACGTLLFCGSAWGAAEERSEVYSLGEVVVTGKGEGGEASQAVRRVTSRDIQDRGARTLDQAIELLPGVNVRTGGEGIPRIDIRGFRTRHVLLLLDGIPLNSSIDQQFDPASISTENIAEIKLTSGASSVLYGQGGLGGVINIITKQGTKGGKGALATEVGDHEPYLVRGSLSGGSGRLDYFLSGNFYKVDGFPLSDDFRPTSEQGGGYRRNSDRERNTIFGNLGFTANQDLSVALTFDLTQGSYGKVPSSVSNALDPFASPPKFDRIDDYAQASAQLAADYQITRELSVRGWTFLNHRNEHDNLYDNGNFNSFDTANGSFEEHITSSLRGVTLQPEYQTAGAGTVTFSLSTEWDSFDNTGVETAVPGTSSAPATFAPVNTDKTITLQSAALEYELSPLPGVGLVLGYGHYWQSRDERSDDDYSLLAGGKWEVVPGTSLNAAFKRNVRFPSLGDLYDPSKGNEDLVPEVAYTYQGGVEQQLPLNSSVSLTGFHTEAKNLIQTDQTTSRSTNLALVRFSGFELEGSTRFLKNLLLRASYSYLHSEDRSRAGRDEQQYTPGNKATLEGKYDFDCGFTPYLSVLYVGDQYFYTKNNAPVLLKGKLNDYALVNLKVSQRILMDRVTLYAGANNLLDKNYETSYGFPQAGRFIYGGVEVRM